MTSLVKKGFKAGKQIYSSVNEAVRQELNSMKLYDGQTNNSLPHQTYQPSGQISGQYYAPNEQPSQTSAPHPPPLPPRPTSTSPIAYASPSPFGHSYSTHNESKLLALPQDYTSNWPSSSGIQHAASPAPSDTNTEFGEQQSGTVYTPAAACGASRPSWLQQRNQAASHRVFPSTPSEHGPWLPSIAGYTTAREDTSGTLPAGYGAAQSTSTPSSSIHAAQPASAVVDPSSAQASSYAHNRLSQDSEHIPHWASLAALDHHVAGSSYVHPFLLDSTPPLYPWIAELPPSPPNLVHGSDPYPLHAQELLNPGTCPDVQSFEQAGQDICLPAELPGRLEELSISRAELDAPRAAYHEKEPVGFVAELPAEVPQGLWIKPPHTLQAPSLSSAEPQNTLSFELPTTETAQLSNKTSTSALATEQSAKDATSPQANQQRAYQQPLFTPSVQLYAAHDQTSSPAPQEGYERSTTSSASPANTYNTYPFSQPPRSPEAAGLTRLASKVQKVNFNNSQSVYAYAALPPLDTETPQGPAVGKYGVLSSEDMSGYAPATSR